MLKQRREGKRRNKPHTRILCCTLLVDRGGAFPYCKHKAERYTQTSANQTIFEIRISYSATSLNAGHPIHSLCRLHFVHHFVFAQIPSVLFHGNTSGYFQIYRQFKSILFWFKFRLCSRYRSTGLVDKQKKKKKKENEKKQKESWKECCFA